MPGKLLTISVLVLMFILPLATQAQGFSTVTPFTGTSTGTLSGAIRSIVNAFLALAALIAATVIAFSFITAFWGDQRFNEENKARPAIIYALIGLVIIALSAVIVNFVITAIP